MVTHSKTSHNIPFPNTNYPIPPKRNPPYLIQILERDKLYRESDLTLQDLAEKLQTPPHLVSQAINDGLKKNFYDVINSYRVEEAKKLLLDPRNKNFTILSIILGCTELSMIVKTEEHSIPLFDTTYLHAVDAVDEALQLR